jgi:N-acetylglutamate synthase-like GNAT family acetyltransferase
MVYDQNYHNCSTLDHRGHGIGQKLVNALIQIAKAGRFENVYLETSREGAASRLYEKIGFKFVKIIPPALNFDTLIRGVDVKTYNYKLK